jgi:hypothetical protein
MGVCVYRFSDGGAQVHDLVRPKGRQELRLNTVDCGSRERTGIHINTPIESH